jgi:hypothetical protein
MGDVRVLIGIPCGGTVKAQLLSTVVHSLCNMGVDVCLMTRESALGFDNRWQIARTAVDNNFTHCWFMDNDVAFPGDSFERLLAHDKDIVGAGYNYRGLPLKSVVKMQDAEGNIIIPESLPKELFKCYAIGNGCQLVKVSALKQIPQPWFAFEWREDGSLKVSDDVWFCQQARKVGIETWCDPTIQVKHIGDFEY